MDGWLTELAGLLVRQSWQIAVLVVLVAAACRLLRRISAHGRYLLWLVVIVKCLVPPMVSVPLAVLPGAAAEAPAGAPAEASASPARHEAAELPPEAISDWEDDPLASADQASEPVPPRGGQESPDPAIPAASGLEAGARGGLSPWQWGAVVWLTGVVACAGAVLVRGTAYHRWLRNVRRPAKVDLQREVAVVAGKLGLRRMPAIWQAPASRQPFVWGVWRGAVYLPAGFHAAG
ncbi:MAG: hypothetical protein ACOC93_05430, partial [Planctomycetota bacterium]